MLVFKVLRSSYGNLFNSILWCEEVTNFLTCIMTSVHKSIKIFICTVPEGFSFVYPI